MVNEEKHTKRVRRKDRRIAFRSLAHTGFEYARVAWNTQALMRVAPCSRFGLSDDRVESSSRARASCARRRALIARTPSIAVTASGGWMRAIDRKSVVW